jgi:hypothetical protein
MDSSAIRAGRVLFFAATLAALAFGANAASASTGAAGETITCTFKTSSAPGCVTSCEIRGLYYYQWYPATQNCCCSSIAP